MGEIVEVLPLYTRAAWLWFSAANKHVAHMHSSHRFFSFYFVLFMFSLCLISKVYGCTDFTVMWYFLWLKISVNANKQESESFLDELIGWFSDHQQQINQLFIRSDADRSGSVSLKDFEVGNPSSLTWIIPDFLCQDGRRVSDFLLSFFECQLKIIVEEKEICESVLNATVSLCWSIYGGYCESGSW